MHLISKCVSEYMQQDCNKTKKFFIQFFTFSFWHNVKKKKKKKKHTHTHTKSNLLEVLTEEICSITYQLQTRCQSQKKRIKFKIFQSYVDTVFLIPFLSFSIESFSHDASTRKTLSPCMVGKPEHIKKNF